MIDITGVGLDLEIVESDVPRAINILSVQLGSLEYDPDFGIDMRFFLNNPIKFQNESFKSYLIQRLAQFGINVATLDQTLSSLFAVYNFNLAHEDDTTALVTG